MRRTAPLLVVPLLLAGCIQLGGDPVEIRRHAIDPVPTEVRARSGLVLSVRAIEVLSRYDRRVVRRGADGAFSYLETERWVDDPAEAIRIALRERLLATGRFSAVVDAAAAFESDRVLEGTLLACDLVDTPDGGRGARLALRLVLADAVSGAVLHDAPHEAVVPLAGDGTEGLGAAMTAAVDQVARDAVAAWPVSSGGGMLLPPPTEPKEP